MNNSIDFVVGDTIKVFTKDPQDNKVHATPFEGIVIAIKGKKDKSSFVVRKIATDKVAVERIFPANSPNIENIKVLKHTNVRRAKLYFLRKNK